MVGIIGLQEGIAQRTVAESSQQENTALYQEIAATSIREKIKKQNKEVARQKKSEKSKIRDKNERKNKKKLHDDKKDISPDSADGGAVEHHMLDIEI